MKEPLLSIIIPVYNVENYLSTCLDTIMNQPGDNYEVICVNDGSTDSSLFILNSYRKIYPHLVVLDVANGGTAAARNKGLEVAKGKYLWFIDSDDWIEKDSIKKLTSQLGDDPDILCFNGKLYYEETGRVVCDPGITEINLTGWDYYCRYALQRRQFHFVCVVLRLYKRDFLIKNTLLFEDGISHEDNLWIPKVMYFARSVISVPDSLYVYRIRPGSKMNTQDPQRILDIVNVANKLAAFFIPLNIDKSIIYREIAGEYFKGFMPDEIVKYGNNDKALIDNINWESFKTVSVYSRHKRIYSLVKLSPRLFRSYVIIEKYIKSRWFRFD